MVIRGKLIFDYERDSVNHLTDKDYKSWRDFVKFLNFKDKYFFEYHQYDDYYSQPTPHSTTDGKYLKELLDADETNDFFGHRENGIYPSLCRIDKIYEILKSYKLNGDIWKNVYEVL